MLKLINYEYPISRAEIARKTRMSFMSASRIVSSLLDADLIGETRYSSDNDGVGRKASYLIPREDAAISIGVELDQEQIHIGFMNFIGELIAVKQVQQTVSDPRQVVQIVAEHVLTMIEEYAISPGRIVGICLGLPGLIDAGEGNVHLSAQFNWEDVPLQTMLEEELDIPAFVENELKLKAFAEYELVNSETHRDMVLLGFGSGVGSVLISGGVIHRGKDNYAGEIGHTIVDPQGNYCPCGNFGCLQTYIAEQFLVQEACKVKTVNNLSDILAEMEKGEKWAEKIIDTAVMYAAMTINNVINIHNPHLVILSGYMVESFPKIHEMIVDVYNNDINGLQINESKVEMSKTKTEGIVIGAALHVQQYYVRNITFN